MKVYKGAAKVQHHLLFTSTVDEGEWSASCPGRCKPEKETALVSIHYEAVLALLSWPEQFAEDKFFFVCWDSNHGSSSQ